MNHKDFLVAPGKKVRLKSYDTSQHGDFKDKDAAREKLEKDIGRMSELQDIFYAADSYSLLIIFQAMDAAGKDGAIKHVMSGLNPQGCQVAAFKSPSARELDHDYLWRSNIFLPERGRIGIFNRSYYEEVLAVRVHPEFLAAQKLPAKFSTGKIWKRRFQEINNFEKYLTDNGTKVVKFFLHVSKDEQKKRFLERIENPAKNWKLSPSDVKERAHWDAYQEAYEDMLSHTSTEGAPWYIVPADKKWFTRVVISDVIVKTLKALNLKYPEVVPNQRAQLEESRAILLAE
jgi:PPK2 family polyphosphate:nucleotide phosphotransferase